MHSLLVNDSNHIREILEQASSLAHDYFDKQDTLSPGRYIPDIVLQDLPSEGIGAKAVLEIFKNQYADKISNSAGPRYFGFVTGGSTPAAVAGDWLVSTYDQNACGSNDTIAPQLERQTIHFFKQLLGLYEEYFGSFVSGATMSNFTGLALGRQWLGEQYGADFSNEGLLEKAPIRILSAHPHSSIFKALSMLGIGRKALIKVDALQGREAIAIDALEAHLKQINAPTIIIGNAGTVNTADFDNLKAIGKLKDRYKFWFHVDAAFGGFAAVSLKYSHLLEGINFADSITVDAHKWLNVPYDAAMQFTRHKNLQLKVFQNSAAYLGDPQQSPDYFHYTPENSRRFRALPSWFSLIAYGKEGYKEIVERNCDAAYHFGEHIKQSKDFKLLAPVRMNIVCFTFALEQVTIEQIKYFLDDVRDDGQVFFTPTILYETPAIRAAISNWKTSLADVELAFQVLLAIYSKRSNPMQK